MVLSQLEQELVKDTMVDTLKSVNDKICFAIENQYSSLWETEQLVSLFIIIIFTISMVLINKQQYIQPDLIKIQAKISKRKATLQAMLEKEAAAEHQYFSDHVWQ